MQVGLEPFHGFVRVRLLEDSGHGPRPAPDQPQHPPKPVRGQAGANLPECVRELVLADHFAIVAMSACGRRDHELCLLQQSGGLAREDDAGDMLHKRTGALGHDPLLNVIAATQRLVGRDVPLLSPLRGGEYDAAVPQVRPVAEHHDRDHHRVLATRSELLVVPTNGFTRWHGAVLHRFGSSRLDDEALQAFVLDVVFFQSDIVRSHRWSAHSGK